MYHLEESNETPVILTGGIHLVEINNFVSNVTILPKSIEDVDPTFAYIVSPYVLPIIDKDQLESGEIGIYVDEKKGEFKINKPKSDDEAEKFSVNNIRTLDTDIETIVQDMINNPDDFRNEKDAEIINLNSSVTTFTIREEDDFLKRAIKEAINMKEINVTAYGEKLPKAHDISNIKSALNKSASMTILNFSKWCYILGLKCELRVSDNGQDKLSPLEGEITIPFNE